MSDTNTTTEVTNNAASAATKAKSGKNVKKGSLEHKYQSMTQYEHVINRPDTYIGSISRNTVTTDIATNLTNMQPIDEVTSTKLAVHECGIRVNSVDTSNGLEKIFDEILVNACDNKNRMDSEMAKYKANKGKNPITGEKINKPVPMTYLKVNFFRYSDEKQEEKWAISVENDGDGIDVAIHPKEKIYVPQMIFGKLLTSGNYDDDEEKITGGKNGYGAKLTNIFSDYFCVETVDHVRKIYYKQVYRNRMQDIGKPEITEKYKGKPYTRVTFIPRYSVFDGMDDLTPGIKALFIKRIYDMMFCSQGQIKIYINDKVLPAYKGAKTPTDFMRRYIAMYMNPEDYQSNNNADDTDTSNSSDGKEDDNSDTASVTAESDAGDGSEASNDTESEVDVGICNSEDYNNMLNKIAFCNSGKDRWQIGATMSPNFQFKQVSFVNGIHTTKGGKHVDYVLREITQLLVKHIKSKKHVAVRETLVRDNLSLFINSIIVNPNFDSQSKDTLTSNSKDFGSKPSISPEFIQQLAKTGIVDRVLAQNDYQNNQILKKTDGKKSKRLNIPKLTDADKAGTNHSRQCTLILTEGDSAKASAVSGVGAIENGSEYYGIFPLRGKLINTREHKSQKIAANAEIIAMKKILGLKENMVYNNDNISELRYGRIMILTDQDVDGSHIKGLLINWLSSHYPSLLKVDGFITALLTPIVKVWKKGGDQKKAKDQAKLFYSVPEYEKWISTQPANWATKWQSKYYKGLGTSSPQESKEYFKAGNMKLVEFQWDDSSLDNIEKAFSKERVEDRKKWLMSYTGQQLSLSDLKKMSFSEFINKELIEFSMYDNVRSIPSVMDGFKPSQRKVLFSCFKRNLKEEIKVAQLAGYVAEHSSYHHGETSLNECIVGMARDFVGDNNINLLMPIGQFGTRLLGGKDHASTRYIFTQLNAITRAIFPQEDDALLNYVDDDGMEVEPVHYAPIIPMVLVNGVEGIGTGWATCQPQYNPLDIVYNIRAMISGNTGRMRLLKPWYRGYKGNYLIEPVTKKNKTSWISHGIYNVLGPNQVEIVELPVGVWADTYKASYLEPLMGGGKNDILLDISSPHKMPFVRFVLTFKNGVLNPMLRNRESNGFTEFENKFHMVSKIPANATIPLFNEDNKLQVYKDVDEIMSVFYKTRMQLYENRRTYLLNNWTEELGRIDSRVRFILDVVEGRLPVSNRPKAEIIQYLMDNKFAPTVTIATTDKRKAYACVMPYDKLTAEQLDEVNENPGKAYDYLLKQSIYTLTLEQVEKLKNQRQDMDDKIKTLTNKTAGDLWIEDLDVFEELYEKMTKDWLQENGITKKSLERPSVINSSAIPNTNKTKKDKSDTSKKPKTGKKKAAK